MSIDGVFAGVRVVELAQYVFVPGATMLMADQGAEVIRVETPGAGDPYRTLRVGDGREVGDVNLAMEQNNHSKKSIALDLKTEQGREALLRLIETADVFVTSLRPRAIRALRLDVEDLRARNPAIIYARGNGLGFRGEEADKAGFDASAFWARSGMCDAFTLPGARPPAPRPAFGDHSASLSLAYAIAGALFKRDRTGKPTVVETSLLATAVWMLSADVTYSQSPIYKVHRAESGVRLPLMQAYPTKDGVLIQLMLLDPRPHWASFCKLLDLERLIEDPRFVDNAARTANGSELAGIIGERIAQHDWAHWQALLDGWNAPWEVIRTILDIPTDPQVIANDMLYDAAVGEATVRLVSGPAGFDGLPTPVVLRAAPGLGEHTDELLLGVGYAAEEIEALKAQGAVQ